MNYFVFFNIDDIALEMNSVTMRFTNYNFPFKRLKYFSKYGRPRPSIGDKHDMIFTESAFSLDSK